VVKAGSTAPPPQSSGTATGSSQGWWPASSAPTTSLGGAPFGHGDGARLGFDDGRSSASSSTGRRRSCHQRLQEGWAVKHRTLLCWVKAWVGFQEPVELAGDIADQAASDLAVGLALGAASLGVGAGRWVITQPGQDDQMQGLVELAVARAVEPNPHGLAAGGRDGSGPA